VSGISKLLPFVAACLLAAMAAMAAGISHAAPYPADVAAYRALVALDARLVSAGYRLSSANADFCPLKERNPGWVIHDIAQYPDAETARAAFGFDAPIQVAAIVQGSAAHEAGIMPDDGFVGIDDATLYWPAMPVGKTGYERAASFKQLLAERSSQRPSLPVKLIRKGREIDVTIETPLLCASDFQIDPSAKMDAGADGKMVSITSALAEYATGEGELAAIVAHELAHNILQHRARLDAAKINRGIGRQFGKSRKAILVTEIEADRLSIWLLANAGFDPAATLSFWQRFSRKQGGGFLSDGTHLSWKKRIAFMRAEADQILAAPATDGKRMPPLLAPFAAGPAASREQ
jgi:beta-barrel assembly-enhancing protease